MLKAFEALRSTRTKDARVHVVDNDGEHLSGRLTGVTDRNR